MLVKIDSDLGTHYVNIDHIIELQREVREILVYTAVISNGAPIEGVSKESVERILRVQAAQLHINAGNVNVTNTLLDKNMELFTK